MKNDKEFNLISLAQYAVQLPFQVRLSDATNLIYDVEKFLYRVTRISPFNKANPHIASLKQRAFWGLALLAMDDYSSKALCANFRDYINLIRTFNEAANLSLEPLYHDNDEKQVQEALQIASEIYSCLKKLIDQSHNMASNTLDKVQDASKTFLGTRTLDPNSAASNRKIFISHSTFDKPLAVAISREIESAGVSTWRDDKDISVGDSIPEEIGRGLNSATHFAIILSRSSIRKPWVKTELENAIMLRHSSGSPKILPILLDGLLPSAPIANIKGIDFRKFDEGLDALFDGIGIAKADRFDLTTLYFFYRKAKNTLEILKWCSQADSFMPVNEEYFEQMEEMERFFETVGMPEEINTPKRFVRTVISCSRNMTMPAFDEDFYTYENCAYAGISLARKIAYYGETMARTLGKS